MDDGTYQDVLILNRETSTTRTLLKVLAARGIHGTVVADSRSAIRKLAAQRWDLVLADLELVNRDGLEFLRTAKADNPELPIVGVGEKDRAEQAVSAMRRGCCDLLVKPVEPRTFENLLGSLFPNHEVAVGAVAGDGHGGACRIVGKSKNFIEVLRLTKKVAPTSAPVLITGESGTGKELVCHYLHNESLRCDGPYIKVNCAALSESLLESELFGHERGAFTGAHAQRRGKFERAHGGTLLLDEISETGPRLQSELLRILEDQDFERVGGSESVRVNVRVISTSNRNLPADVSGKSFRRDLYYRICGVHLHVPPLRERVEDIPILVRHFVNQYAREVRRRIDGIDAQMLELFKHFHWPGNVRQLRNVVRTAVILGEGDTLSLDAVPHILKEFHSSAKNPASGLSLVELERQAILEALRRTGSHQARAAKLLGITDRTLREKIRRYRKEGHLEPKGSVQWQKETV